jgi:hypothetical protein
MCSGGRLLADFEAGTCRLPDLPDEVARSLTVTADGEWVVWAHKLARRFGTEFAPLTGGGSYPAVASARCRWRGRHPAPQPSCTCGFHALSSPWPGVPARGGPVQLEVALTGRVLAFEWQNGGLLFRAARQTVLRVDHRQPFDPARRQPFLQQPELDRKPPPDDPEDRLARSRRRVPRGAGPLRLRLPEGPTPVVAVADDAGFCAPWAVTTADAPGIPALVGT